MKFIIRPYSIYHTKLSKGYRIIDEFIKEEYLKCIANNLGIKSFYVKNLYENEKVMNEYLLRLEKNKEMDFNMILQYSDELVHKCPFIGENIGNIIRSIQVDEYQDTNQKQYDILSQIVKANKKINLLFVGDMNQAIYSNLGGVAKSADEIRNLFQVEFTEECLKGCYRSTQRIVNYYTNHEVLPTGVVSVSKIKDNIGIIKFNESIKKEKLPYEIVDILKNQLDKGIPEHEICIVAPQWFQIYPIANKLRKLMPNNNFDALDISPIKYDPLNVFFLIAKLLFTQNSGHRLIRRKEASEVINTLRDDYGFFIPQQIDKMDILRSINCTQFIEKNGILTLKEAIKNVYKLLNINANTEIQLVNTYNDFFEKIHYRVEKYKLPYDCESMKKCFKELKGIVINTIHGIKGEEYTTMIGFDLLTGHLPHWNYIYNDELKVVCHEETNKMLYVLCSRAKENLYLFAERGRKTKKGYKLNTTKELANCGFTYDI